MINQITVSLLLLVTACINEPIVNDDPVNKWQKIAELEGMDIWDVKIHNDEIYIAGKDVGGKGVIYKSSDAINWENFSPSIGDSLDRGVGAIDFYNGKLIASFIGKPVYEVTAESVKPLTGSINNDVREMIVDKENNILIGTTYGMYYCKYITPDSIYNIYDWLSTPPNGGCYRQAAIVPIGVTKFLRDINSDNVLIGNNAFTNHFITAFSNRTIDCFPMDGLRENDKYFGCLDMIYISDTLYAAGNASIKYLDNNEWKTYGDTLPKTSAGSYTIATSIAYDNFRKEIYVAANYIGVVKWVKNSGWEPFNEGLESYQEVYDFIPDINYFKGILLLTYGTSKSYRSTSRGAMFYSLK